MQKRNNIMLHFHGAIEGNQAICLIEDGYLLEENKELRIETTRKHHYL